MKMRKIMAFVLAMAITVPMALTGCSQSSSSKSSSSAKPIKLTLFWWGSQQRNDATIKLTQLYTKEHPNVTFTNEYQSFDGYFDKLSMLAAANNMPDVLQFTVGQATGSEFITKGLIQPLDSYVANKEIDLSDMSNSAISTGKIDGKLYGLVLGTNALGLAVDPAAYKKAGLTVPENGYATWDDLGKDLVKLKAAIGPGGYGADDVLWIDTLMGYWCRQYGETEFNTAANNINFSEKTYVTLMNLIKSWMSQGLIPPLDISTTAASDPTNSELAKHKSSMDLIYSNNFSPLAKAFGGNLEMIPLPGPNGQKALSVLASQHLVMSSSSASKDEAAKFMNFFVNDIDANKILNAERGIPAPTKVLTALTPGFDANTKISADYMKKISATAGPVDPPAPASSQSIYTLLDNLAQQVIYNKITPEQAYAQIQQQAKKDLANS